MARIEVNNTGAINGKELIIIYEDDKGDPKTTVNAMEKLASVDKVPIVFGSFNSGCVLAQAPIAEKTKTPILAEAQSPRIRDAGDYVFRIQPDSRLYMQYFIPYIFNDLNIHKIAILYINNAFGNDITDIFTSDFSKLGGTIVFKEAFQQGTTDFKTQLNKIKQLNPEGIFVPAVGEIGYVLKQAYEMGLKIQILGNAPTESPDVLLVAGKGAEGVIYCHHFDAEKNDSITKNFATKYYSSYNRMVEGYSALAYDGLKIIAQVLIKCGSNRDRIKDELYKIKNFRGVTGLTSFDDHGDVIKPIYIKTIKDGKFVTIWESK
jgi:branched-chain amino acid transport system substrate-binding protein